MHYWGEKLRQNGEGNPDRQQNLMHCSLGHASPLQKYSKSVYNFLTYLARRHRDRQAHRRLQKHNRIGGGNKLEGAHESAYLRQVLAFNAEKFRGSRDPSHAPFWINFLGSCPDCPWEHFAKFEVRSFNHF